MFSLSTLIWIGLAIAGAAYAFVPNFRTQVNQVARVTWNKIFRRAVSPLERQKDLYRQLIEQMKQQKASVASVMATAKIQKTDLDQRVEALEKAKTDYADAKNFGMDDAELNKFANKVTAARAAVEAQQATVTGAESAVTRARQALEETARSIEKFAETVQTNEGKVELTKALEIANDAREQSRAINDKLSEAGQATSEIDRALAEQEAREELDQPDATDAELEKRRAEAEAKAERERLDAELSGEPPAAQ